jgi:hypothetical protein
MAKVQRRSADYSQSHFVGLGNFLRRIGPYLLVCTYSFIGNEGAGNTAALGSGVFQGSVFEFNQQLNKIPHYRFFLFKTAVGV